jgi:tetratricopeptide (TPR) repeat protein
MGADADTRRHWLQEADAQGRALLLLRSYDPEAMAWAAAARGRRALAEPGARTVVGLAEETWQLTGELLAAHPDHPLGNHVRGKLHQEVARLPRVKRILARMFLRGDMLGQAKWELAEQHIQRAIAGDPGMVLFYLDLGETYRYQGKEEEALAMYRRGLAVPDRLPVDERFKSTMRRRIATLEGTAPTS